MQAENTFSGLSDDDYANLTASGLSDETIRARGYKTITSTEELLTLGFSNVQSKLVPCLYMPRLDKTGESHLGIIRPMAPRIKKNGEGRKYEIAFGDKMQIDFPVANHNTDKIDDPTCDLYVTEGIKKGDALAQNGLAAIDLLGVWNFKGRTAADGTAAIWPGYDEVPLFRTDPNGKRHARTVVIAFDSDVARKKEVHDAMMRFAALLGQRGARVQYLYLPAMADGAKQGADDFFAGGGPLAEFLGYIKDKIEPVNVYDAMPDKDLGKLAKSLGLLMTEKGKVQENQFNLQLILGSESWLGRIRYDDFTSQVFVDGQPFDEMVDGEIVIALGRQFQMGGNHTKIRERAVKVVAQGDTFDTLQDWLNELPAWDKTPRLVSWMHNYFGAEATTTNAWIGWMMIMQMVSRAMRPGSQARYVVILEGVQDLGKSEALMELCPEQWFSAYDRDINNKDALIGLRGKWLVEIAELQSFSNKTEVEKLKSFISTRIDSFRPVYGERNVEHRRRACMVGTTNSENYLKMNDENTRFFPVVAIKADRDGIRRDRDQLFAEALAIFEANPTIEWWDIPESVNDVIKVIREDKSEVDFFRIQLAEWSRINNTTLDTSTHHIVNEVLKITSDRMTAHMGRRIAESMRKLGWQMAGRSNGNTRWVR